MANKRGLKYDFSLLAILLIPIGIAINFVGAQIVMLLKLPIFLNTIGTILTAMIGGPWVGMVTGASTNLVVGITNPVSFAFTPVQMAVGLVVGFLAMKGMYTNIWKVIISSLIVMFTVLIVASPIQVIMFGGATGNSSDAVVATFLASGQQIWTAVFSTKILVESFDKILSNIIAFGIVMKMSPRYLSKLNYGANFIKKKA
ncbi:ECF transporter S component [Paenibacillus faecalis]|uniref:ECF transporter S component n=1 Tax=Paenibacillus faecalis TaxID=2079532 RepID=UPI000D0FB08F|nr:ECF transporter S component [Paenibacillus faecalis]